jgi:hypothetical protein
MTTGATTLLGLALPVQGELSGTWGDTVNNAITQIVDASIAGTQTITLDADITLTTTTGGSSSSGLGATSAQYAIIRWAVVGGTVTRNITVPAQSKTYIVINDSTTQSIVLRGSGPTTGVTLLSSEKAVIAWSGTDFVKVATNQADGVTSINFGTTGLTPNTATAGTVAVAGTLVGANGGTGYATYTAGDILYSNAATTFAKLAIGASKTVMTSTGSAPQWTANLDTSQGGTGLTTYTAGDTFYYASGTALSKIAIGTNGQALVATSSAPAWTTQFLSISYVIDGGGATVGSGIKGDITVPFACTISEWTLLADQSGTIAVDIWKDTYANYPPTIADVITGSAVPTITTATKAQSSTLTGWTTTIAAGDTLRFNVNASPAPATITRVTLSLKVYRT